MAYKRTNWKDHVVQRPRTYTKVANGDGSETYTPSPGEVLQQGTPQSATNFNNIEEGLQHASVAFDWLCCIMQAHSRAQDERIATLEKQVAELSSGGSSGGSTDGPSGGSSGGSTDDPSGGSSGIATDGEVNNMLDDVFV